MTDGTFNNANILRISFYKDSFPKRQLHNETYILKNI